MCVAFPQCLVSFVGFFANNLETLKKKKKVTIIYNVQRINQNPSFSSVLSILIVRVFAGCVVNNTRRKIYFYA